MKCKIAGLLFLLTFLFIIAFAQADKWTGTWQMSFKPWKGGQPILLDIQIGLPDQGMLYPAKINLKYGQFKGIYEMLLVYKNERQLGISRGKYPILEIPFKLGIWLWYLNGTLDLNDSKITVNRKWINKFDIWMRGFYDDGDLWESSKADLRDFLYRDTITLRKTGNNPLSDSSVNRILHSETSNIYLGKYNQVTSWDSLAILKVEDQEMYDKDTVTLLHNGKPIFNREEVNDHNRIAEVRLDTGRNLFIFFADNYGKIPPNTGFLYMKTGGKEYGFDFSTRSNVYATFLVADIYRQPSGNAEKSKKMDSLAAGRTSDPVATIPVDTADILLELWDDAVEDGDSISLRLNGEWITTGFPVKNALQKIPIRLHKGENSLIFMADNLGSIPPNTAVLRIRYGLKTKIIGLNTDMRKNNELRLILE
ncbi:hypothetical protein ACX0G9_21370 [Flavitalea flava]